MSDKLELQPNEIPAEYMPELDAVRTYIGDFLEEQGSVNWADLDNAKRREAFNNILTCLSRDFKIEDRKLVFYAFQDEFDTLQIAVTDTNNIDLVEESDAETPDSKDK